MRPDCRNKFRDIILTSQGAMPRTLEHVDNYRRGIEGVVGEGAGVY